MFGIPIPLLSIHLSIYLPNHPYPPTFPSSPPLLPSERIRAYYGPLHRTKSRSRFEWAPPTPILSTHTFATSAIGRLSSLTSSVFVICRLHLESSVHLQKRKGETRLDSSFMSLTTRIAHTADCSTVLIRDGRCRI